MMLIVILDLLILSGSKLWLPVGIVALVIQVCHHNNFTPYWADIIMIVIGLVGALSDISWKRNSFAKHNSEVDRKRLERKKNKLNRKYGKETI